jgi:hypothetical protein
MDTPPTSTHHIWLNPVNTEPLSQHRVAYLGLIAVLNNLTEDTAAHASAIRAKLDSFSRLARSGPPSSLRPQVPKDSLLTGKF